MSHYKVDFLIVFVFGGICVGREETQGEALHKIVMLLSLNLPQMSDNKIRGRRQCISLLQHSLRSPLRLYCQHLRALSGRFLLSYVEVFSYSEEELLFPNLQIRL
jgi:hypothetical protein